jgi:hypothetical protein
MTFIASAIVLYVCLVFSMWFEYPELLLLFLIMRMVFFLCNIETFILFADVL